LCREGESPHLEESCYFFQNVETDYNDDKYIEYCYVIGNLVHISYLERNHQLRMYDPDTYINLCEDLMFFIKDPSFTSEQNMACEEDCRVKKSWYVMLVLTLAIISFLFHLVHLLNHMKLLKIIGDMIIEPMDIQPCFPDLKK
jgi:hypothetical protein